MTKWIRIVAVLAAPFLLTGCLLTPGKFSATLDINADRSFTFTYIGEVHAVNMDALKGLPDAPSDDQTETDTKNLVQDDAAVGVDAATNGMTEAQKQAIAAALAKEAGYRIAEYRGNSVFFIDYAMTGRLTHSFVFPYNLDAEIMFPFVVIEPRANGGVRVKAPAFGKAASNADMGPMPPMGQDNAHIDGEFTLTTNAEIISQNNEDGAATTADGRKQIRWRITPATADAPTAVLRMAP